MILTTILLITLAILTIIVVASVAVGGAAFVVVFGDVIVCVFLIVWFLKWLFKKKR